MKELQALNKLIERYETDLSRHANKTRPKKLSDNVKSSSPLFYHLGCSITYEMVIRDLEEIRKLISVVGV